MSQAARRLKRDTEKTSSISLWEIACDTHPLLRDTPEVWFTTTRPIMKVIEGLQGSRKKHFKNKLLDIIDEKICRESEIYDSFSAPKISGGVAFEGTPLFYTASDPAEIVYLSENVRITKDAMFTTDILCETQIHAVKGKKLVEIVGPSEFIDPDAIVKYAEVRDSFQTRKTIFRLETPEIAEVTYRDLFGDPLRRKN